MGRLTLRDFVLVLSATAVHAHPLDIFPPIPFPLSLGAKKLNLGVIGDSWASGVTYGLAGSTDYDDNTSGCMRLNNAYGVQLKDDFPGKVGGFKFAACSGATMGDMVRGQRQMDQLPSSTNIVTMQSGGNNAGFFNLAVSCIFHSESGDYGGEYPSSGRCLDAINSSQDYIRKIESDQGFAFDMGVTINDMLNHPIGKKDDSKLYVLGYAHLFNDGPESDWCNDQSFSVSLDEWTSGKKVKLTQPLRARINDLTTQLNDKIQEVVRKVNDPRVSYVSITEGFNGHRFCEAGSTWWRQYFTSDSWLWNVSPDLISPNSLAGIPGSDLLSPILGIIGGIGNVKGEQDKLNAEWDAAYNQSLVYRPNQEAFNWSDLLKIEKGPHAATPHQGWSPGVALRPFHPKKEGHTAIKNALKAQIEKDFHH